MKASLLFLLLLAVLGLSACGGKDDDNPPDFDNDNIIDTEDPDDDNDGYDDVDDAFPKNSAEWLDTDLDGIGNNEDEDDDGDGIPDSEDPEPLIPNDTDSDNDGVADINDPYPEDFVCSSEIEGGLLACYLSHLATNEQWQYMDASYDGSVSFYIEPQNEIVRLGTDGTVQNRLVIPSDLSIEKLIFHPVHGRFYTVGDWAEVTAIEVDGSAYALNLDNADLISQIIGSNPGTMGLIATGNYIGLLGDVALLLFDINGQLLHDPFNNFGYPWLNSIFNPQVDEIYTLNTGSSPRLTATWINPVSGETQIIDKQSAPLVRNGDPALRLSQDGRRLAINNNGILDTETFEITDAADEGFNYIDAAWSDSGSLIYISYNGGFTELNQWLPGVGIVEQLTLSGAPLKIVKQGDGFYIVSRTIMGPQIHFYSPSNDSDEDGVANDIDDFPTDPAASIDTDKDGFPDQWNEGKTESDSTTGLTIDSIPSEPDCWLNSHVLEDGSCDFSIAMENLNVVDTALDSRGFVYILGADGKAVYQWSVADDKFTRPLRFNSNRKITAIAVGNSPGNLYVGMEDGSVEQIVPSEQNSDDIYLESEPFWFLNSAISQLETAGAHVLAKGQNSSYWYVINNQGNQINRFSSPNVDQTGFAYSQNNALYYVANSNPRIYYMLFNESNPSSSPSTGSRYFSTNSAFESPLSISPDGGSLLSGDGQLFNVIDRTDITLGRLLPSHMKAHWTGNDELVLVREKFSGRIQYLEYVGLNQQNVFELVELDGFYHASYSYDEQVLLILEKENRIIIEGYSPNGDVDSDGVANKEDQFPTDPAAAVDSDLDGYPDAWNEGYSAEDSTANLTLDAFPEDAECWTVEHGDEDGLCDYSANIQPFTSNDLIIDSDGENFFVLTQDQSRVLRWNASTQSYEKSIGLGESLTGSAISQIAFSPQHNRLYLSYHTGAIYYAVPGENTPPRFFAQVQNAAPKITVAGNYLVSQSDLNSFGPLFNVFDINGNMIQEGSFGFSFNFGYSQLEWDGVNERLYQLFQDFDSRIFGYQILDQQTGELYQGEAGDLVDAPVDSTIIVSSDGTRILLTTGDVFEYDHLSRIQNVGRLNDAVWLESGELITAVYSQPQENAPNEERMIVVKRFATDLHTLYEEHEVSGTLVEILPSTLDGNAGYTLVTLEDDSLNYTRFEINNDVDDDGVVNSDDAFPTDPSASADSDQDGYPDAWNEGFDGTESNLQLDAFPQQASCWLTEHSDGEGNCDFGATLPELNSGSVSPENIVMDESGIVYTFLPQYSKVLRWNPAEQRYLNPIQTGVSNGTYSDVANQMLYSPNHDRLYIKYESGQINYVNLNSPNLIEQPFFSAVANANLRIHAAGNYVVVSNDSSVISIVDINGTGRQVFTSQGVGGFSTWDESTDTLYYIRNSVSNQLFYLSIDARTGEIIENYRSDNFGNTELNPPLITSSNGSLLVAGSGDVFNSILQPSRRLNAFDFGAISLSGDLVTVKNWDADYTITRYSADFSQVKESTTHSGQLISLASDASQIILVELADQSLTFTPYLPNDDSDNDGVDNLDDDFPHRPEAALDSDNDGYPDAWNEGFDPDTGSTDLVLDAFPDQAACWLSEHDDGSGNCDFSATMPANYSPSTIFTDVNGIVHMFSPNGNAIYRWSIDEATFIDPIAVGLNGLAPETPIQIAYAEAQSSIFVIYESGVLNKIELNDGQLEEQSFTQVAGSPFNLVSVGDFVFVQSHDAPGSDVEFYQVYDSEGVRTGSAFEENIFSNSEGPNHVVLDETEQTIYIFEQEQIFNVVTRAEINPETGSLNLYIFEIFEPFLQGELIEGSGLISESSIYFQSGHVLNRESIRIENIQSSYRFATTLGDHAFVLVGEQSSEILGLDRTSFIEQFRFPVGDSVVGLTSHNGQIIVVSNSPSLSFQIINYGDGDGDQLPNWWELKYGLSDDDAADATADIDEDGVDNLTEFLEGTSPILPDSDEDELNDYSELNVYATDPLNPDSDFDNITDGREVNDFSTDPNLEDSDEDDFSDYEELFIYDTNPNDPESLPEALASFSESFEGESIPGLWETSEASQNSWFITGSESSDGNQSLRAGDINDSQSSGIQIQALFNSGELTFDYKVDSENCCDRLRVYIDGNVVGTYTNYNWTTVSLAIPDGEHVIEWRYVKDGSVSSGQDTAWIDNIVFN